MGEDSVKKKKKKAGPAEARKRRKAIITSHRAGGVSSSHNGIGTVAPPNNNTPPTSEDTAVGATTATLTTEPSSMMEAAMAAALAEASTPLMEAAVLAAATAAVESTTTGDDVVTPTGNVAAEDTTTTTTVPSESPAEAATEDAESKETASGETAPPSIKIETPASIDNDAKSDAGLPKPDEELEATDNESDEEDQSSDAVKPRIETLVTTKQNAHGSKKKTQVCYEPSVPMPKDQLAAWRREARKVRNRESAAASRQRTRSRIAELEDEVTDWKDKYNTTLGRLQELLQQQQHHQTLTGHVDGVNNTNGGTGTLA